MSYYTVKGLVKGGLPILILTCFMAITVGLLLGFQEDILIEYPTLLILLPVLLKIGGDTGSMLSARLSSAFHLGLGTGLYNNPIVRNSVIAAIIVAAISSVFVTIVVYGINSFLGYGTSIELIFGISFIVVVLDIFIVYAVSIGLSFLSHRVGLDPDDIVIPVVASTGDLVGVVGIMIAIVVFGLAVL
ncbi:MAG: magnesium transporter [Methanimicrococcus sp.]|nr:magnesium transporter [Methanimicrococcus sp.]